MWLSDREARNGVLQKDTHELKLPGGKKIRLDIQPAGADGGRRPTVSPVNPNENITSSEPPAVQEPGTQSKNVQRTQSKNVQQEASSLMVLIENIPDNYSSEILNLLVENITDKNENSDFNMERIPEMQCAVITFTCDVDILSTVEKFSRHARFKALHMKATLLEETSTVRVEGLPPNTSEDYIGLYFENSKHGGSGSIDEILVYPDEDAALVTFSTVEAAKNVLCKKHQFNKKEISIYPYYPSANIVLYGNQRPHIQIPAPLIFPVSPYILEFILSKAQFKKNVEEKFRTHTCEIKWPVLLCSNPEITLCFPDTLSTHLRTLAKLAPTWKDEVHREFSSVISKFKVVEYRIDQSVWDAIKGDVSSPSYKEVIIKPDFGSGKVFLAGLFKDVNKIDATFRKLVEQTTKHVERKSQSQIESLPMSPALYHIICNSGLLKNILQDVPELKIEYNSSSKAIELTGLKTEVLTARCAILENKHQLKCKSLQMNPYLVQFLMSTDNENLSCLLFIRHNINALLEIDDDTVKLMAFSKNDLGEAEEQINQELVCRQIVIEENGLLKIPEWISLHSYLLQSYNKESRAVLIQESSTGADKHVAIAGLSSCVQKCFQQVNDFLEKNTSMEKNIKVKYLVVMQFLKEEKKHALNDLKDVNISICNKNIRLKGPKLYVTEAYSKLNDVIRSVYSDTLYIDKPGAKKFCLLNEDLYVTMAKNKYKCFLRLQKEDEEETAEDETEDAEEPKCQINLPSGVAISVYKGDLCRLTVDVVVNAANEDLQHVGGLALALLKAAGPILQDESDEIVKTGRLSMGESVITNSGKLPCKQVIHTVGPRWNSANTIKCERLLQKAITSSLELAEEYCHTSIAIPAVSSGIFGCPVDKSAENIIKAIKQYIDNRPKGRFWIKEIHLVDTKQDTVQIFASTLKREFGEKEAESFPKYRETRAERVQKPFPKERVYEASGSSNQVMTKENIIIRVTEGLLQNAATDVIVNSVGKDLRLDSGGASRALLSKAGNKLQQCLMDVCSGSQVVDGSVFITEGCNLSCKIVIHVVAPEWDKGKGSSEKTFRRIIKSCLCESEKKKMTSITFPAIGTGILGFPKRVAASFMFEEIYEFSSKNNPQYLKEVSFILHPSDKETLQEFSKELNSQRGRNISMSSQSNSATPGTSFSSQVQSGSGPGFFGTVNTPKIGTHEMKVGSVTYQVKIGDITKEDTDIIVNSTDRTFTMKSGVSKAILEAAGQSVQDECTQQGSQGNKDHIVTQNGNLRCKKILHKVGINTSSGIKPFITEALTECARLQATSVAFPAIGTGMGNVSSSLVADSILDSVADYVKSPQSIQTVKVVIFQEQMLNDFFTSMKKKEGGAVPKKQGLLSKVKKSFLSILGWNTEGSEDSKVFELRENIEPAIFQLCASSQNAVDNAKKWLHELILKEQYENLITDDWIQDFDEKEREALFQLQKTHQVSLVIDVPNYTVKVVGLSRDVLEVSNNIQDMIKKVRDNKTREREAELCSNLVEWGYMRGSNFVPFDKITNMELEKAKNEDRNSISIDINGEKYTVIVELLSARDSRGNNINIQRKSKHEKLDVPDSWAPMQNDNMKVVPLVAGSKEYADVEAEFRKTCQMRIIKIEQIQNRHLWINYQIKKQSIDAKNGSSNNEKKLFHGLDESTVNSVNINGFNRSYAGKNAACYGNGTYFAVNANYSAHDQYSRPNARGIKHMYLSRVVTGISCKGTQGMIAPPPKNAANPTDLHDSVTDNPANPAMYVIFHDIQAYPEYLITFTK